MPCRVLTGPHAPLLPHVLANRRQPPYSMRRNLPVQRLPAERSPVNALSPSLLRPPPAAAAAGPGPGRARRPCSSRWSSPPSSWSSSTPRSSTSPSPTSSRASASRPAQPLLGAQRLHPHLRGPPPPRRAGRRPPRPADALPHRHRRVHRELAAGRLRGDRLDAPRRPGRAGPRRRPRRAVRPVAAHRRVPRGPRARARHRPLHDDVRGRRRHRAGGRRPSDRARVVALGHVRERPDRPRGARSSAACVPSRPHRRHGHFDAWAAADLDDRHDRRSSSASCKPGSDGWRSPSTIAPSCSASPRSASFVVHRAARRRADPPAAPLREPRPAPRRTSRGLLYAGMFGMFFFLAQFLQDVQGYTPLRAGVAFLPMPASVFLASQLTSRVLIRRLPQRAAHAGGRRHRHASGLLLATQLDAATSYGQILVSLVLLGAGHGHLLRDAHHGVAARGRAEDAGAASGLINVSQQLGAALGLAVLVNLFQGVTRHGQLVGAPAPRTVTTWSTGWTRCSASRRSSPSSPSCS